MNFVDPSGLIIDTVADVGFIGYDGYRILRDNVFGDCDNLGTNLAALGADAGAAIPFATGGGAAVRVAKNIDGGKVTVNQTLDGAEKYLGEGYKEIAPGVYRNGDRQFRITDTDLTDTRIGPHANFESIGPDGRKIVENSHVRIIDP